MHHTRVRRGRVEPRLIVLAALHGLLHLVVDFEDDPFGAVLAALLHFLLPVHPERIHDIVHILGARRLESYLLAAISKYMDRTALEEALTLERLVEQEAEKRLQNVMSGFVETMTTQGASGCNLPLKTQQRYFAANTDDPGV